MTDPSGPESQASRTMSPATWSASGRTFDPGPPERPRVMGILNVTPDSFSDGGRATTVERAVAVADQLIADGADLLDIGGESTRPGSEPVPVDEEIRRVVPAIEALAGRISVPISIDTMKPEVARRAVAAGASIVNDVTGLSSPEMRRVVAESGCGAVAMHMQGTPQTMQVSPQYEDVVGEVLASLESALLRAERDGIPRECIAVDPGIGFGKTFGHNLDLLRNLGRFATLGCVLLVGTSRKRFLGEITGRAMKERAAGTVASSLWAVHHGARIVRVHDVAAMADAVKIWHILSQASQP